MAYGQMTVDCGHGDRVKTEVVSDGVFVLTIDREYDTAASMSLSREDVRCLMKNLRLLLEFDGEVHEPSV